MPSACETNMSIYWKPPTPKGALLHSTKWIILIDTDMADFIGLTNTISN